MSLLLFIACFRGTDALVCPEGSVLEGETWQGDASEAVTTDVPSHAVRCTKPQVGPHGPARAWYANGQVALDLEAVDGQITRRVQRDPWGRVTVEQVAPHRFERTYWYANGTRAGQGILVQTPQTLRPEGWWEEWDQTGRSIARIEYREGAIVQKEGSPRRLRAPKDIQFILPSSPPRRTRSNADWLVELPRISGAPTTESPSWAPQVTVTGDEMLLQGEPIDRTRRRGQLLLDADDRFRALQREKPDDLDGRLVLVADADTPLEDLRDLLVTAEQASFHTVDILVHLEDLRWPPLDGPEAMRGDLPVNWVKAPFSALVQGAPGTLGEWVAQHPGGLPVQGQLDHSKRQTSGAPSASPVQPTD